MPTVIKFIGIIILISLSVISFAQVRHYGRYLNPNRYWTDEFILNQDSTFIYKCKHRTNDAIEYFDTSAGKFVIHQDTLWLTYHTNNYYPFQSDSPEDSLKGKIIERHGYFGNRPQKLYWKRKKLYYIIEDTGEIYWSKEIYMRVIK